MIDCYPIGREAKSGQSTYYRTPCVCFCLCLCVLLLCTLVCPGVDTNSVPQVVCSPATAVAALSSTKGLKDFRLQCVCVRQKCFSSSHCHLSPQLYSTSALLDINKSVTKVRTKTTMTTLSKVKKINNLFGFFFVCLYYNHNFPPAWLFTLCAPHIIFPTMYLFSIYSPLNPTFNTCKPPVILLSLCMLLFFPSPLALC